jgi:hypothetical protein
MKRKIILIIEIIVLIAMIVSVIYSIGKVKIIAESAKDSSRETYIVKKDDKINIKNINTIEIINVGKDKVSIKYNDKTTDYKYDKKAKAAFYKQSSPIELENGYIYEAQEPVAYLIFMKVDLYKPVVIAGGIIILACTVILIKTKKPKGEKENGRND